MTHRIFDIRFVPWCGFSYHTEKVDYRNWVTTDFYLCLGFIKVTGWIP